MLPTTQRQDLGPQQALVCLNIKCMQYPKTPEEGGSSPELERASGSGYPESSPGHYIRAVSALHPQAISPVNFYFISLKFYYKYLLIYVCGEGCICHSVHVEVSGQFVEVRYMSPREVNSVILASKVPLPAEPSLPDR